MNTPIATRTDIPTPDQVEVWLTLGDASKKLSQEPSLTFVPAPTPDSPVIKLIVKPATSNLKALALP